MSTGRASPNPDPEQPVRRHSLASLFYGTSLFVLGGYVLWIGQNVLVPLVIAAFLSFLIVTIKKQFERIPRIGPLLPQSVLFGLSFSMIVLVLLVLVSIVRTNIGAVAEAVPAYTERLGEIWSGLDIDTSNLPFQEDIASAIENIRTSAIRLLQSYLTGLAGAAGGFLGGLVTVLLYTAFILIERGRFLVKMVKIAGPDEAASIVSSVVDDLGRMTREYITVKTFTSFLTGALSYIILIALEIDFAGFWALVIFALNYIPVIGSVIGVTLPTFLALVQPGGGIGLFFIAAGLLTAAQQLCGSVIEPRMMGRSLNLSPLVILLSLAAWGSLWGIPGMFLCVPITVILMIVLAQFESTLPVAILLSDNGDLEPLSRRLKGADRGGPGAPRISPPAPPRRSRASG